MILVHIFLANCSTSGKIRGMETLHDMLNFYEMVIGRARHNDDGKDGYLAYLQPAFGASSGISHEVWAETFDGAIDAIKQSIAKS